MNIVSSIQLLSANNRLANVNVLALWLPLGSEQIESRKLLRFGYVIRFMQLLHLIYGEATQKVRK